MGCCVGPVRLPLMKRVFALLAFGCVLVQQPLAAQPLKVVTTTTELRNLVEIVGGDRVAASHLIAPNTNAEHYQAKPQDLARVKEADLIVRVGLDYDLWLDRLLDRLL